MELANIPYIVFQVVVIAAMFLIPSREVTQPPGKRQVVWEILFPGTSLAWGYFGGLALAAWCYLVLTDIAVWHFTPYIITSVSTPNLSSAYGVRGGDTMEDLLRLINPSWVWVYLAPAVLFVANLVLVLRSRRS